MYFILLRKIYILFSNELILLIRKNDYYYYFILTKANSINQSLTRNYLLQYIGIWFYI